MIFRNELNIKILTAGFYILVFFQFGCSSTNQAFDQRRSFFDITHTPETLRYSNLNIDYGDKIICADEDKILFDKVIKITSDYSKSFDEFISNKGVPYIIKPTNSVIFNNDLYLYYSDAECYKFHGSTFNISKVDNKNIINEFSSYEPPRLKIVDPTLSSWQVRDAVIDKLTGEIKSMATSPMAQTTTTLGFPYHNTHSIAYLWYNGPLMFFFSNSPNIVNDYTHNGYDTFYARLSFDGAIIKCRFRQDWGSKFIQLDSRENEIKKYLLESDVMLLELNWYGEGSVVFEYSLNGSDTAIYKLAK